MSYPAEIDTRVIELGPSAIIESAEAVEISATIKASDHLVRQESGYDFPAVATQRGAASGDVMTCELPITDQTGWLRDGALVDVSDGGHSHSYTLTVDYLQGDTVLSSKTWGPFVLPLGDGEPINLANLIPAGDIGPGVTVSIPDSWTALVAAAQAAATAAAVSAAGAIPTAQKGAASGVAELDAAGKLPMARVPDGVLAGPVNAAAAMKWSALDAAFGAPSSLYLSRIANDYTFLLGLGSGRYGAFFLPRRSGTASSTTYTVNALCGFAVALMQLAKDAQTDATFGGSGSWTTVPSSNLDGTSPNVRGRLYGVPRSFTVSTTASSTTVTVTAGGPLVASDAGRRITIPGAGASGADLVTTIGTVNIPAGTFTVGTAPSATLAGATGTISPDYRHNSTSGATVTWASPANATALGMATVHTTTGGLAKVTVTGASVGAVVPTGLLTAQDVVDRGIFLNNILIANGGSLAPTDRVKVFYENSSGRYGYTSTIAADLTPDTYTVTMTNTGYTAIGGTGSRMSIDRFGYALVSTTPTTAGAEPFIELDGSDMVDSAWEYAVQCRKAGTGTYTFVGQAIHWYDQQTSFSINVTGGAAPADGQTVACNSGVTITRTTDIFHPDSLASKIATGSVVYKLDSNGFSVTPTFTVEQSLDILLAYVMFPNASRVSASLAKIDRATLANALRDFVMTGSGKRLGISWSASGWAWDSTGKLGAAMYIPDYYAFTEGLNAAAMDGAQWEDRGVDLGLPLTKLYAAWIGSPLVDKHRTVAPGWSKTYEVQYRVGYFSGGAAASLARA